ncbi:GNAT family N-acetyltransferase [Paenibacillus wynnii]|uniref:GNAT family N-acetyltransferase n=1 Tax=Paenibacillus wynnii TaxID=268407 RepID=UPI0027D9137A|nr:GNAT family protein [Paenibacillus wynnii]
MGDGHVPVLTGQRLLLRAISVDDAEALFHCWSNPEVSYWLGAPMLSSVSETRELIVRLLQMAQENDSLRFSIVLPEGTVIGSCAYNNWQLEGAYRGELGCELLPEFWGCGYMREALRLLLKFGFESMGLNRIEVICRPDNARAVRLFTALGFRQEGILRQYRHTEAGFQDVAMYSLLNTDGWQNWML